MEKLRVLITGSSRGIGVAIKKNFAAKEEYELFCPTREELNLSDVDSIKNYLETVGFNIDVLINNAGVNIISETDAILDENIDLMFDTNLKAPLFLIRGLIPSMKEKKKGRIVNISSIWGVRSKEKRALYSITKFGINGLTRSLARELGEFGILVNSIAPGYVNTEMTKENVTEKEKEIIVQDIPLKRFAEPNEIANTVEFLVSDANTYITGQTIIIDGGFLA